MRRLGLLVLTLMLALALSACGEDETIGNTTTGKLAQKKYGYEVGKYCPDFTLDLIDSGEKFTLSENNDKVTVINFWACWCSVCQKELPELNKLAGDFAGQVNIIAISTDNDDYYQNETMEFIHSRDMPNLLFAFDSENACNGQMVGETLNVSVDLPVIFVVDQDGQIIFHKSGQMSYDELLEAVAPTLNIE